MNASLQSPPSLCFVVPYFGRWPFWMPFFLESCRANPSIDWLLFSDCGQVEHCPPNVRIMDVGYDEYCARVSRTLGIEFAPQNPYKLCDLKPALGHIHEEELRRYDFWAFGDLDLVFGDLRAYFTPERLAHKDLLSTHRRRVSGHCCLLRNTKRMREAFRLIKNWKKLFADQEHYALDEGAFSRIFIRHKNWPDWMFRLAAQANPWYRRAEFVEAFSTPDAKVPWVDGGFDFPRRWFWNDGVVSNDRDGARAFPYFHFPVWKKNAWSAMPQQDALALGELAASGRWEMSEAGFHAMQS
tara:strand:- start:139567 stop:140460 length:894 start_codon:yes stop_codon:yes gene_type:complete